MAERMTPEPPRFEMRGVRKTFGATLALDDVDLSVRAGEICALVGQNGAGKSTLMSILSGAQQPDAGTMRLDGAAYAPRSPIDARRAGVAMIYQELSLAPHLSVMENILLGAEPRRYGLIDRGRMRAIAAAALRELGHGDVAPETVVGALQPAAQQIVEIARAIAIGSRVLVFDEPTSSLGLDDTRRLFELLQRLKAQGLAIVYISHFIEDVQAVADRFVVLRDGRNAGGGAAKDARVDDIVALMVGRPMTELFPRSARAAGEPLLDVQDLEPGGASFTVRRGEIVGITGLIGSGRTRLMRTLFALEPIRSGRVRLGVMAAPRTPHGCWQAGLGLLSEDRKAEGLALGLSVADNLTLARLSPFGRGPLLSPRRQRNAAELWVRRLDIKCRDVGQPAAQLSGGTQQKVALARLLHADVDVLLLDEPTRGIDVGSKAQIYQLIDALVAGAADRLPKAVLMVSSYLPELTGFCDRVAVMRRGRLGAAADARARSEHELMLDATGGTAA